MIFKSDLCLRGHRGGNRNRTRRAFSGGRGTRGLSGSGCGAIINRTRRLEVLSGIRGLIGTLGSSSSGCGGIRNRTRRLGLSGDPGGFR